MWSWHCSPLTQTSLLLSPSDGLASFLKTTLDNGVKVVKKIKTSNFRFHLIAIYALGCFRNFSCTLVPTKITLKSPNPRETSERMNFNVNIDKKQLIWKLFIYWYLISLKKCHKMFGPPLCHLDQWRKFFTGPKFFFRASHWLALIWGTLYTVCICYYGTSSWIRNHCFQFPKTTLNIANVRWAGANTTL